ncbi:hypothetical protein HMPREF1992_00034 [Selenomonas sp. oral taxon 892 str. F0426]|nr:hypothetical protein HMPREF1992_00034 [Selenomonas sp. oral taxon 892 str. F0426]
MGEGLIRRICRETAQQSLFLCLIFISNLSTIKHDRDDTERIGGMA